MKETPDPYGVTIASIRDALRGGLSEERALSLGEHENLTAIANLVELLDGAPIFDGSDPRVGT